MKKLLIIGAGFLQTFVIKKAKEMGYYVLAIDGNPYAVGKEFADEFAHINIVDKEACLCYAKEKGIDGVMTAATDYGVISAAFVAENLGLRGISTETAALIKNKYRVRKCLFQNRINDSEQAFEVDSSTDLKKLKQKLVYPVMVKPCDGSGSRGAARVDTAEELFSAAKNAIAASITGRAEIESFIFGKEYGAESIVIDGMPTVLAVMQKDMTQPPYYAELGHAVPSSLPKETEEKIKSCVKSAIKALGINFGAVNMDIIATEDGKVSIVDIGARMGGNLIGSHIIPLGTGIDYLGNLIRAAVGDSADLSAKDALPVATRLLALSPGEVAALPSFEDIEKEYDVKIYHHLNVGDTITPYRTNLDGCGYIVATAQTVAAAKEKAEKALSAVNLGITRK
ncbi:MAG: ATP-grasp domain-containing protein [Oscillospiraceae bacterium]|nr:ATP-grasp domain-containing protein [Oscillospiraceae bacterium]